MSVNLENILNKSPSSNEMNFLDYTSHEGLPKIPEIESLIEARANDVNISMDLCLYTKQRSSPASRMDIEYLSVPAPLESNEISPQQEDSLQALPLETRVNAVSQHVLVEREQELVTVSVSSKTSNAKTRKPRTEQKLNAQRIEELLKTGNYFHGHGRIKFSTLAKDAGVNNANLRRALLESETFYTFSPYLQERHDFEVQYLKKRSLIIKSLQQNQEQETTLPQQESMQLREDRKITPEAIETLLRADKADKFFHKNKRINFGALATEADVNRANLRYAFLNTKAFYTYSHYLTEKHDFEVSQTVPRKK